MTSSGRSARSGVPWRKRPREDLFDVVPTSKLVQALWALPYITFGVLVGDRVSGYPKESVLLLAGASVVVGIQTTFSVLWLMRPRASKSRQ